MAEGCGCGIQAASADACNTADDSIGLGLQSFAMNDEASLASEASAGGCASQRTQELSMAACTGESTAVDDAPC